MKDLLMYINPISKPLTDYHGLVCSSFYNFREGTALDVAKRVAIIATAPIAYAGLAFLYLAFRAYDFFVALATPVRSPSAIEKIRESIISNIRTIARDIQTDNQGRVFRSNKQISSVKILINYSDDAQPLLIHKDYTLIFTPQDYTLEQGNGAVFLKEDALKNRVDPITTDLEQIVKNQDHTFKLLVLVKVNDGTFSYAEDEMTWKEKEYARKPGILPGIFMGTPPRKVHRLCESLLGKMGRQMTPEFNKWLG